MLFVLTFVAVEEGTVRLAKGHNETSGPVEMFLNNTWTTLCGEHWEREEAEVVCRMVDFRGGISTPKHNSKLIQTTFMVHAYKKKQC